MARKSFHSKYKQCQRLFSVVNLEFLGLFGSEPFLRRIFIFYLHVRLVNNENLYNFVLIATIVFKEERVGLQLAIFTSLDKLIHALF
jgi:hypothetical protein